MEDNVIPMSVRKTNDDSKVINTTVSSASYQTNTVLSFRNVKYSIRTTEGACRCFRTPKQKQILSDISGVMKPGLNAIMGPTGSGKSSLLDILAGRKDPAWLTGEVLINGNALPKNFKRISGYVVQSDIVIGTLTVRENLWFSANMRLPQSVSYEQKMARIEDTLSDLGLNGCADTKVGNAIIRGISGGEKKRACIAMELITSPAVLFLDEPTTGLDASTANAVMILLKRLGERGRTIVLSIHQPRYSIFRLFDSLTLLSLGKLAYHGPLDAALPYFDTLGYHCEEHNNPADFFLDVINGDSTAVVVTGGGEEAVEGGRGGDLAIKFANCFRKTEIFAETDKQLSSITSQSQVSVKSADGSAYATPFYYQLAILSRRAFKNVIRNPIASVGNLFINIVIGVVFGILFYQVDTSTSTGTQNRFGVLFFICTNLLFGSLSAIEIFVAERDIFIHEYVSGYYRVIAYFLAKLFADLIPMRTIAPMIFAAITYWMVGLKGDAGAFFTFLLMVILIGYSAVAIALFFSATFNSYAVASLFITLTFVFSILFAGLLLNIETVFPWLAWIKYLSVANYGFSGLAVNEFRGLIFTECSNQAASPSSLLYASMNAITSVTDASTNQTCFTVTGESFLNDSLGIGGSDGLVDWDLWVNVVALLCISTGMFTLTYIQLARTKTYS